ncbi:MAG: chorismate synthase [Candidatus Zixiibacteriota bacterium]|nr:MAG: chorismate synthase [candidate division Zixibacteria bacterium]
MIKYLTSGESHGPQMTVIIDGFPAGFNLSLDQINYQLRRRQESLGRGDRMKIEKDTAEIVSGVRGGVTLGFPITLVIPNLDWPNWANIMNPLQPSGEKALDRPRPGHADLPGAVKLGHHDIRNVLERASARETVARVAAGSLARQFLEKFGVQFASHVIQVGKVKLKGAFSTRDLAAFAEKVEKSPVRSVDSATGKKMEKYIKEAAAKRDSLGGAVEVIVRGIPVGLGHFSQWYRRLDSRLAAAVMSIPSVKAVEIGLGMDSAGSPGSKSQDEIFYAAGSDSAKKDFYRKTNNAGGIEGGISNGEDIIVRFAAKPVSTLKKPLRTVNIKTKKPARATVERADTCIVPVLGVIGEAAVALVLADAFMEKFGSDNIAEIERNYHRFLGDTF